MSTLGRPLGFGISLCIASAGRTCSVAASSMTTLKPSTSTTSRFSSYYLRSGDKVRAVVKRFAYNVEGMPLDRRGTTRRAR